MMNYSDHFASVDAANKQKAEMAMLQMEQQKRSRFKFPTDGKVWHFHPIAFVEQMRRMGNGRAPWMEIAYGELGVEEIEGSKHNARILEYHNTSNSKGEPDETAWCGAFVNWVMKASGYSKGLPQYAAKAVRWKKYGKTITDKNKPPYGSIACIAWTNDTNWGSGHVGFVVAVDGDDYYLLGGNQKGGDKNTEGKVCISRYKKSRILSINIPVDYDLDESDYEYDKIEKINQENMETYRALGKLIIIVIILFLAGCKNNNKPIGSNQKNVNKKTFTTCNLTIEDVEKYSRYLSKQYKNNPDSIAKELTGEALTFYNENNEFFNSIFNSDFKTRVRIDTVNCEGVINYSINTTLEEDGEEYNIESSTILIVKIVGGKIKVVKFNFAG